MQAVDLDQNLADQIHLAQGVDLQQSGTQGVIDVMIVIGDVIGDGGDGLGAGELAELQRPGASRAAMNGRNWSRSRPGQQRTIMFDHPLNALPGQVETVNSG